jgi:hypothetical protein
MVKEGQRRKEGQGRKVKEGRSRKEGQGRKEGGNGGGFFNFVLLLERKKR